MQYRCTAGCRNTPYEGKGYYHDEMYDDITYSLFANSDSKSEQISISTPTRGGDAFGKELARVHMFGSLGLNLTFEGYCWGQAFVFERRLPQASPASWDLEFVTPVHNVKEALPCFVGSQRRGRSLDEGLGERARKKLSGL
jgi:hypothetical protein